MTSWWDDDDEEDDYDAENTYGGSDEEVEDDCPWKASRKKSSSTVEDRLWEAFWLYDEQEWEEAIAIYEELLEEGLQVTATDHDDVYFILGDSMVRTGWRNSTPL